MSIDIVTVTVSIDYCIMLPVGLGFDGMALIHLELNQRLQLAWLNANNYARKKSRCIVS